MTKLLTIRQTADVLGLTPATVTAWIAAGKLRAIKLGDRQQSRVRVPSDWLQEDLERFGYKCKKFNPHDPAVMAQVEQDDKIAAERFGL